MKSKQPLLHLYLLALPVLSLSASQAYGTRGVDPEEFVPTLEAGSLPSALGANLLNMTLHGAHHVPLQMQQINRYAWITGDYALNDRYDSESSLLEAGAAMDLFDKQLVAGLGFGQSWVDQDLLYGGDIDLDGQYLLGELSYRSTGCPMVFTLTGTYGDWDADVTRNYINGPFIDSSSGSTGITSGALRLRADWLDVATVWGFSITPKVEYTVMRTKSDAYTETGGGFPAAYNDQSETSHQVRYGLSAVREVLESKGLLRIRAEGVHRFDDSDAGSYGTASGFGTFSTDGTSVRQDWLLLGLDFDYKLTDAMTLTSGLSTSTTSQDPVLGTSLGLRMSF